VSQGAPCFGAGITGREKDIFEKSGILVIKSKIAQLNKDAT
jgi:hypothetical protein